ncbi:MAG: Rab family GTPase [Candidatus Hodarchaeota archaeon]
MKELTYKICIFGEGGVGKTTLTRRYLTGLFEVDTKMTMGAEIFVKNIDIEEYRIVLQIWDFGGEEMFRFLLPAYAKGSSGGLYMFDMTRYNTLKRTKEWLSIFEGGLTPEEKGIPILLIGGKLDLQDQIAVNQEEAERLVKEHNLFKFVECSAKTGENVELLFEILVRKIMKDSGFL